ncbi:MFS transporter [Acetobacteraceae bacterium KSS8]|uniref:MFS transporter n=1 Tax=Endosaccharibacter trunci TaxID=2812733 RepID=A0ABT1WB57_9PROT|nr:MFS transporter [Acetobacteraceae bacterium KSS8]
MPVNRDAIVVTLTLYAFALMTMATIGVIVPFVPTIAASLHVGDGAIGLGIALFSLPPALLATIGGAAMDRIGIRGAVIAAAGASMVGDLIVRTANSIWMFDAGLVIDGFGLATIAIGAPALLIATLRDATRTRAMAFLSTFAPTGFALGLLIAIPFTGHSAWRAAMLAHVGLALLVCVAGILMLPAARRDDPSVSESRPRVRLVPLPLVRRYWSVFRLGLAIALPNGIAYGTSIVAPSYLARIDGVSLASSAGAVAGAKIAALLLGGLVTGQILAGRLHPWLVFVAMAVIGVLAQALFFLPSGSLAIAILALVLWLFAFGGLSGVAMSLLPGVMPGPDSKAVTTGVVNQFISVVSFAAPSTYLAMPGWGGFLLLAAAGLMISVLSLPRVRIDVPDHAVAA